MASSLPVTQQICSCVAPTASAPSSPFPVSKVEDCLIYDRHGVCVTFKSLYQNHKAIVIFVRNFLCYTCQEYVEDLSKIPQEVLLDADVRLIVIGQSGYSHIEAFCSLTGYQHEIYVDPERHIYTKLGMTRGENYEETGNFPEMAGFGNLPPSNQSRCQSMSSQSPHVKSSVLVGSIKSMWRAMTSPAFDFQGDPLQQGGALIIGPGPNVHFAHFDMNRFNHMPINGLLQLAGMKAVDFNRHAKITDI